MEVLRWIEEELRPALCDSERFIYDDMDSQSGRSLPIIYQPFDPRSRSHWRDRGALFDFLSCVDGQSKRLLDFGPGDGWPSLIVAPFAAEVVGVDGSKRRVSVCTANAQRLGIHNAEFVFVAPGSPLPFGDRSFDGVMAASSVEQTPDPRFTLGEILRVLRPAGRLRIYYESLSAYRNGKERDIWLCSIDHRSCRLVLFDRDIAKESVRQYGLTYAIPKEALARQLATPDQRPSFDALTIDRLQALAPSLIDARICTTKHPSGRTLAAWLKDAGFAQVEPTHSGSAAAGMLFDRLDQRGPLADVNAVDDQVRPVVQVACQLACPVEMDPMITAVK